MLAMVLPLLAQVPAIRAIARRRGEGVAPAAIARRAAGSLREAWSLVRGEPMLLRFGLVVLVGGVADTLLKYAFYWLVSVQTSPAMASGRTLYFTSFYLWVNGLSLLVLVFGSARIIRRWGLLFALLSLPLAVALGTASLAVTTVLAVMYVLKVVESALHTTLYEPGLDHLYLAVDDETSRRARPFLSGLLARLGEGAGAVLVLVLNFGFGISLRGLIGVLLAVLLAWVAGVLALRSFPVAHPAAGVAPTAA
jgi:AAA family ATP:ADP antiporter